MKVALLPGSGTQWVVGPPTEIYTVYEPAVVRPTVPPYSDDFSTWVMYTAMFTVGHATVSMSKALETWQHTHTSNAHTD